MKSLITYLTILSSVTVYSQHIPRYTYHDSERSKLKEIFHVTDTFNNVLEGPYLSYYMNGNIESKGQFSNNETVGVWEFYYETGKLKMRGALKNNSNYGVWEYFFENGNKQMEGKIINRKREGPWKLFYESGELKYEGSFNENKRSGLWKSYYEDGKLQSETQYDGDKGETIEYYHSGEKKGEGLKAGLEYTGHWKFFHKSGILQSEGKYVNGKRSGEWIFYHPGGQVSSRGVYVNGSPEGKWSYFHETGSLNTEGKFTEGVRDGIWNAWYPGGGKKSTTIYQGDAGEFEEYHENGQLKSKGTLVDGVKHGTWQYFYNDGRLEGKAEFDHGRGRYEGYYPDGTLQTTGLIENEHRIGTWEIYDEKGSLKGYYKPFYESDSLSLHDMLKKVQKPAKNYGIADYAFGKSKFPYFNSKTHEYHGIIVSINPLFPFIGRLPIAGEFYLQERLGHELLIEGIRDPFFETDDEINLNTLYTRGYLISLRQKLYNPDDRFGMFYFGHALSFSNLEHHVNLPDMEEMMVQSALENKYLYSILAGYRFMKNTDERSFTMDGYVSFGTGYRTFVIQGDDEGHFDVLSRNKIPFDFNFGITFGYSYPFNRKK